MSSFDALSERSDGKEKTLLKPAKDLTCQYCLKQMPKKEDLFRCKDCKLVAYCGQFPPPSAATSSRTEPAKGRACQKADWGHHKDNCWRARSKRVEYKADHKLLKSHLSQSGSSSKEVRMKEYERFNEWVSVNLVTIYWASICAARVQHGSASLRSMPLNRFMFILAARPRITGTDDPSTTFVVSNAMLRPLDVQREPVLCDVTGTTQKLEDMSVMWYTYVGEQWRALDRFLGIMPVLCSYAEAAIYNGTPMLEPLPQVARVRPLPETHVGMSLWERWLPIMQAMVQRGHVLGPMEAMEDIDMKARVGTMQKVGENWEWVQMSDEDARRFNYPEFASDAFASGT
ncbi:hypothetical protein EWM64_g4281 [Hericium alpestre]|uniref:Uncharacterized protein n=1 Tax=Hericium alpestre TaxID=135208 RepID=A0A4Y9ZY46_9AGAM|nr:hypothetical protein EWM64_g4281 [Hericium alpestre]